jgi:poly-beta-1,6-N-acetyl-D-glucosamine synthase
MTEVLLLISESPVYFLGMIFLAAFPVVISALAINGSRQFLLDRSRISTEDDSPHLNHLFEARTKWPTVSIVIPARNEEAGIEETIQAAMQMYWPNKEIIVINDGSLDHTLERIQAIADHSSIQIISHKAAAGKSISLNEGIAAATSEIVVILDADARPAKNVLDRLVPHFLIHEDVAAVTGNPRVANLSSLLSKLQAIEFTSNISTLRRGQAAWGRVNTISGIMTAFRRREILEIGGFSPIQPTEDIEMTWRLHREGYRCVYEPAAQIAMEVPESLSQWWKQRTRWSTGLVRVLQTHGFAVVRKWEWPVFPLLLEAVAAILWCHLLIAATLLWIASAFYGIPFIGNSVILSHWGTLTLAVALFQIFWGMRLDSNHDKGIVKLWPLAPLYPLFYWWLSAFAVVATTVPALLSKPKVVSWSLARKGERVQG